MKNLILAALAAAATIAGISLAAEHTDRGTNAAVSGTLTTSSDYLRVSGTAAYLSEPTITLTASATVMTVSGIPHNGHGSSWTSAYQRPKKAEDVKATLWTDDGREWRAKWEEVKP